MKRSLTMRLMLLFSLLLAAFTVLTAVIYNALMVRQSITHHSQAMQRDAFAIAQNLSELVAPPPMTPRWTKPASSSARKTCPPTSP